MYLLDTNTLSELRKGNMRRVNPGVAAWGRKIDRRHQYLSVITVQETEMGILQIERDGRDPLKAETLRRWFEERVLGTFQGRILPIDLAVARRAAQLHAERSRPVNDTLIACTAFVHGLTMVTRNVRDFEEAGVRVLNPWEA